MNLRHNPIDRHVGTRVASARRCRDVSQEQLSELLGLSLHTLRKYEAGGERIDAGVLRSICQLFDMRPGFFFEGMNFSSPALASAEESAPQLRAFGGGFSVVASDGGARSRGLSGQKERARRLSKAATVIGDVATAISRGENGVAALAAAKANDSRDRRMAERRRFRVEAVVQHDGRRLPAMVDNISLTGIKLADPFGFSSGETVQIELGGDWIAGKVVWVARGSAGLQFERPLPRLPSQSAA